MVYSANVLKTGSGTVPSLRSSAQQRFPAAEQAVLGV